MCTLLYYTEDGYTSIRPFVPQMRPELIAAQLELYIKEALAPFLYDSIIQASVSVPIINLFMIKCKQTNS